LPLILDTHGKRVLVFGGGEVGLRKAKFFAHEAKVTVISNAFVPGFDSIDDVNRITTEIGPEQEEMMDEADFVIIATGDHQLNDRLESRAIASCKYCNRADGVSTFLIPSIVERRNFLVAITTLGRSPAMSRFLRILVDENLGAEMCYMIDLQEELREKARSALPDQASRERYLWEVLGDAAIWDAIEKDPALARALAFKKMGVEIADNI
jgi:precorrin-2 dehydrogenase / sirohydrochlorin ferrochelatase